MNKKDVQLLLAYDRWANAQLLDLAARLTPDQLTRDLSTSHRSLHETFTHILAAEWVWLKRCQGNSPRALLDPKQFPGLDALREKWAEVEQEQSAFVAELSDEHLDRVVRYINFKGEEWAYSLRHVFQHVVNHSTYHRGQVVAMLRQLGATAVMTDFLAYIDINGADV
jgi:uncharacterized damage-inducible protein DinB